MTNLKSYNAIADVWAKTRTAFYGREQVYLDAFLDGLSVPSPILDLGCGTGRPMAEYIMHRGHEVTGVDQAVGLLRHARTSFPQAVWIESSIENFASQQKFSGIICWDALFHIERSQHESLLQRMCNLLDDDGRLMLTMGGSAHPAFEDTMLGEIFFYDSHPPEKVLELLGKLGFEIVIREFMNQPTTGRDKGRYAIVARRK